jgi:hypothetical protein
MVLLGVNGIRRKLRVKLWGKMYLGSGGGRSTKVIRNGNSISICRKGLEDTGKISFSLLSSDT